MYWLPLDVQREIYQYDNTFHSTWKTLWIHNNKYSWLQKYFHGTAVEQTNIRNVFSVTDRHFFCGSFEDLVFFLSSQPLFFFAVSRLKANVLAHFIDGIKQDTIDGLLEVHGTRRQRAIGELFMHLIPRGKRSAVIKQLLFHHDFHTDPPGVFEMLFDIRDMELTKVSVTIHNDDGSHSLETSFIRYNFFFDD